MFLVTPKIHCFIIVSSELNWIMYVGFRMHNPRCVLLFYVCYCNKSDICTKLLYLKKIVAFFHHVTLFVVSCVFFFFFFWWRTLWHLLNHVLSQQFQNSIHPEKKYNSIPELQLLQKGRYCAGLSWACKYSLFIGRTTFYPEEDQLGSGCCPSSK